MSEEKKTEIPPANKRKHKATFASDKKKGGYNIRIVGPEAAAFAGREVPVTLRDGTEHVEKLLNLIWSGKDKETGENCALYFFVQKPRQIEEAVF